jgi:hypothetical protein
MIPWHCGKLGRNSLPNQGERYSRRIESGYFAQKFAILLSLQLFSHWPYPRPPLPVLIRSRKRKGRYPMADEHPQEQEEANQSPWRTIPASEVAVPAGYVYVDARATERELELTVRVAKPLAYCTLCEAETGTLSKNGVSKLKFRDIPQGNRRSTLIIVRQRYVCQQRPVAWNRSAA